MSSSMVTRSLLKAALRENVRGICYSITADLRRSTWPWRRLASMRSPSCETFARVLAPLCCYNPSSGLRTPFPPRLSTCVYIIVVDTLACPKSS